MKTKYKGTNSTRTSGWKSQTQFDILLSELDVSSLKFLVDSRYPEQLRDFRNNNDLNDPDSQQEYKVIQQKLVMADEELGHRMRNINASPTYQNRTKYFDSETGLILDEHGDLEHGIAFDEEEEDLVYDHTNNSTSHPTTLKKDEDESDYDLYKRHTRVGVYKEDWNTKEVQFDESYDYESEEE